MRVTSAATTRESVEEVSAATGEITESGDGRRLVSRIHRILRDNDGSSSLLERFDEFTKLLFLKAVAEGSPQFVFARMKGETDDEYVKRLRDFLEKCSSMNRLIPERFATFRMSDSALSQAADALAHETFVTSGGDICGIAFEEMIHNTYEKGENQQFFTPPHLVGFLTNLLEPDTRGLVCDPACGTGGFLAEIARRKGSDVDLLGLEVDERLAWVSRMNLFLHGATRFEALHLPQGGSLGEGALHLENRVDVIVTNPPFGSDFSGPDLQAFQLGSGRSSRRRGVLFVERCLQLLRPGGLLGIILDESVLSGSSNADVRDLILSDSHVLAVIKLPETAFMPYASVSTSILILQKKSHPQEAQSHSIFFASIGRVGKRSNGSADIAYDAEGKQFLNSDLPGVLTAWKAFRSGAPISTTLEVRVVEPAQFLARLGSGNNRLDYNFHCHGRGKSNTLKVSDVSSLRRLGDVCEVRKDSLVPATDLDDQMIPFTGLAEIEAMTGLLQQIPTPSQSLKSAVRRYEPNDVLFAKMRPGLRKVAHVSSDTAGYASGECVVLLSRLTAQGDAVVNPALLSIILRSDFVMDQIAPRITGSSRPRISERDLLDIRIPLPSATEQERLLSEYAARDAECRADLAVAQRHVEQAMKARLTLIEATADKLLSSVIANG